MYNVHGYFLELARIETLYRMGRWGDALGAAASLPDRMFDEAPRHPAVPPALDVRRGAGDGLAERLREAHEEACSFGEDPCLSSSAGLALVELAARDGRFDEAREAAARTLDLLLPGCLTEASELAASAVAVEADRAALARLHRDADDEAACLETARRTTDSLRAATEAAGVRPDTRIAAFLAQAEAELARVAREPCADEWRILADRWAMRGEPYPEAYAAFRAAEGELVATARPDGPARARAAELLARAAETAGDLGAAPLVADIDALARRARLDLAPEAEPAPAHAPDDLGMTPREREVLRLLAEGRSNGDIGRALFISTKTASTHVSNILRKLGAANRVEAAGVAIRLGLSDEPD
jgi:DNA-binding CsgD family transcriptional regulator